MPTDPSSPPPSIHPEIGTALKTLRRQAGWSLDEAARHTGVSKAMLGQIERGESSPTVATLWKLAGGFRTSISAFLDAAADAGGDALPLPARVRAGDMRSRPAADRMLIAPLFAYHPRFGFEMLELTLLPGYERLSEPHAPGVVEHVMAIRGSVEVLCDGAWQRLEEGDALRFAADLPHGYRNAGDAPAVFHNLIHYPPGYRPADG